METVRHTLSLAFIFLALIQVTAQTNGGFETWLPSGSPPPFDWLYPEGWTTNNATTEFITSGVKRSTDEHSGTYSAELRTLNIFGTFTRAQLALGSCLLDPPNYSILAHTGGEELSSVPSQVTFNYKLTSGAPGENAECVVLIKRGPSDTLWHTSVALTAAAMYTQVSVPFPDIDIIQGQIQSSCYSQAIELMKLRRTSFTLMMFSLSLPVEFTTRFRAADLYMYIPRFLLRGEH